MHTKVVRQVWVPEGESVGPGDVRIHYNGDWSGEATLQWCEENGALGGKIGGVQIPGGVALILLDAMGKLGPPR